MATARALALAIVAAILVVACDAVPHIIVADGQVVDGWVFPTAAPLPEGAVLLPLDVEAPPRDVRDGVELGACPLALMGRVSLVVDRTGDPPTLHFLDGDGKEVRLRWSYGVSAREIDGVAEVVMPDGDIIVREGELSRVDLGGGFGANDASFNVCITRPHRVEPGAT